MISAPAHYSVSSAQLLLIGTKCVEQFFSELKKTVTSIDTGSNQALRHIVLIVPARMCSSEPCSKGALQINVLMYEYWLIFVFHLGHRPYKDWLYEQDEHAEILQTSIIVDAVRRHTLTFTHAHGRRREG